MKRFVLICAALGFGVSASSETVTIHYDDFGIPHIYADTAEGGLYASGWAMASDRLVQTLENYLRGMGRFSAAYGPGNNDSNVRADLQSLMWDHYGKSKELYKTLPRKFRAHNKAFVEGINAWMKANPEGVPEWWTYGDVDVYMPVAFSRQFIWGWPIGQAAGDLRKVGLSMDFDIEYPYSNEIAIAPERTTFGAAALIIDPHLSWFGRQRYWEVRIHAGDVNISGFATAGFPYVNLGHNEHVAWAHTTGGPDTADIYELTLNPENKRQYRYDGEWLTVESKTVTFPVKGEGVREVTFYSSHHGPIVAQEGNKAYAAALAYDDAVGYLHSKYLFMIAKDYKDVMTALEVCEIMPQNVMVADTGGNIYYQRTGRVPVRPAGYDFSAPVNGSTSRTEWQGLHKTEDFVQVLNPAQGYMQNCNISPDVMMVSSPMEPSLYPSYIFNQPGRSTHQRATRATEILHTTDSFSVEEVIELALDKKCYQFDRWVDELQLAHLYNDEAKVADYHEGLMQLGQWDGYSTKDSKGALYYYVWKKTLAELAGRETMRELTRSVNNYLDLFGVEDDEAPEGRVAPEHRALLSTALENGMASLKETHGTIDLVFGDVFRAGRLDYDGDNVSYPVGGGSLRREGMATLRAIGFTPERADHTRWGTGGQTSTEVVVMTTPIQSWTQPPIGQSDHPDSPHFRDQAEKLMSGSAMKPSWFNEAELRDGHIKSTMTVEYPGR